MPTLPAKRATARAQGGTLLNCMQMGTLGPLAGSPNVRPALPYPRQRARLSRSSDACIKRHFPFKSFLNFILKHKFSDGNFKLKLIAFEDNDQCITGVKKGCSGNLRHLGRARRVSIGSMRELFYPSSEVDPVAGELDEQPWLNCFIKYCPGAEHKSDFFTKALDASKFSLALSRIGMRPASPS